MAPNKLYLVEGIDCALTHKTLGTFKNGRKGFKARHWVQSISLVIAEFLYDQRTSRTFVC